MVLITHSGGNLYWKLRVLSFAKRRDWKFGEIVKINLSGEDLKFDDYFEFLKYTYSFLENIEKTNSIVIKLKDHKQTDNSPFPDIMSVNGYAVANKESVDFLSTLNIAFSYKPVTLINCQIEYFLLIFPVHAYINHEASNTELKNNRVVTKGKEKYVFSESKDVISTNSLDNFQGICRVKEYPMMLICDEITKVKLIKEKLTGIDFQGLQTA